MLQTTKQVSRSRVKSIESLTSLRGTNTQDLDLVPMQINNVGRHVFSRSEDNTRDPANPADNGIANVEHTREKWQNATDVQKETTMDENSVIMNMFSIENVYLFPELTFGVLK